MISRVGGTCAADASARSADAAAGVSEGVCGAGAVKVLGVYGEGAGSGAGRTGAGSARPEVTGGMVSDGVLSAWARLSQAECDDTGEGAVTAGEIPDEDWIPDMEWPGWAGVGCGVCCSAELAGNQHSMPWELVFMEIRP